jgi:undecaprenyl-diphosphatase
MIGVIVLFLFKKWFDGSLLFVSLFAAYVLNKLLKNVFERDRPFDSHLINEDGFSFPSGNAMIGTTFYMFAAFLLYQKFQKSWIIAVGLILPILLGVSRVYVGVHYPSDILAGYSAGVILSVVLIHICSNHKSAKLKISNSKNRAV